MSQNENISALRAEHSECLNLLSRINFDGSFLGDILPVTYFASIIELVDTSVILLEHGKDYDIYPTMRVIQEISVDISNMSEDEGYFKNLLLAHEINWKKLLQQAVNGNQFLASIAAIDDIDDQISMRNSEMKKLRREGAQTLKIFEKFERAGRTDEYRSVYRLQSMYTHNSLQASINRHLVEVDEALQFSIFKEPNLTSQDTIIVGLTDFLRISKVAIEEIFSDRITHPSSAPK